MSNLLIKLMASPVAQMVKSLLAMQESQVQSLGQEDPLEKEMATHSRIFASEIPRTEEPGRLQSMGWQRVRHGQVSTWKGHSFWEREEDFLKKSRG